MNASQLTVSVWNRLFGQFSRYTIDESKDRVVLDDLLVKLTRVFFEPLAKHQAHYAFTSKNPDDEIRLQQDTEIVLGDFRRTLDQKIVTSLKKDASQDAVTVLLNEVRRSTGEPYKVSLHNFIDLVQGVFLIDNGKEIDLSEEWRKQLFGHPIPLQTRAISLITYLAESIQQVVLDTPAIYYSNISDAVPAEVKVALDRILMAVEVLRLRYTLKMKNVVDASILLNIEIARADRGGYVWLPIRSLIAAPLSAKDLQLYARSKEDATKLAHQMMSNEGVFLITGYRGVGKSTFINQSLALCHELERNQREMPPIHIIPITISLAKASSMNYVLRLCVRKLYEELILSPEALLTKEEQKHLIFSYYRSVYKVSIQEANNVQTLKHLEAQLGWSIKFGSGFSSGINPILPTLLPNFDTSAKISRDDSRQLGSTVALLDYDEDKAEEDLVNFIKALASHELPPIRKKRLKLVFVFDEIDKMSDKEQGDLISQLKNLFLARYAVFLLVTSKEFYYTWLEERKKEDTVLASYFSGVEMVPLFTSEETRALLKHLICLDEAKLKSSEISFLETFAYYLTYSARGIPRDIIRELQRMEQWLEEDLQMFITNRSTQYNTILLYAQLQTSLENILAAATSTSSSTVPASSLTDPLTIEEATILPEYIWKNKGRLEQIRLGLYILIEELLDLGKLILDPDDEKLTLIYKNNFKMVAPYDFNILLQQLYSQLCLVSFQIVPGSELAQEYPDSKILKLFLGSTIEHNVKVVEVSKHFYKITGRSISFVQSSEAKDSRETYPPDTLHDMLMREEVSLRRRAISALQQQGTAPPTNIALQLCQIFISQGNDDLRWDAVKLLKDPTTCATIFKIDGTAIKDFAEHEKNERLLQEFVDLISVGQDADTKRRLAGTQMLLQLIAYNAFFRYFTKSPLLDALRANILSILIEIADEDVLEASMKILDPQQDVDSKLLKPLMDLANKYHHDLIEVFIKRNMTNISDETLKSILHTYLPEQLGTLWSNIIGNKGQEFERKVLIALLQERRINEVGVARAWVNKQWDTIDKEIVKKAKGANPAVYSTLKKMADANNIGKIDDGVLTPSTKPTTIKSQSKVGGAIAVALGALLVIVWYFLVSLDQSPQFDLQHRLASRLFELIYVLAALVGVIGGGTWLSNRGQIAGGVAISGIVIGVASFVVQFIWFRPVFTVVGQLELIGLLFLSLLLTFVSLIISL